MCRQYSIVIKENSNSWGKYDVLQNKLDEEGNATIFNECYDILQNKSDEGNTSKTQDLEHFEEVKHNNNNEANDSIKDDLSEKI